MVKTGIRGEICHSINRYAKANNKYLKDYDKNNESSYLKYWDVSNEGCFLEVDVQHPEKLHDSHSDLPFLPERIKIEKVENIVANL